MPERAPATPPKQGFWIAIILTALIFAFSKGLQVIGLRHGWAGFVFFWFWSSVRGFDYRILARDTVNALAGVGIAFCIGYAGKRLGAAPFEAVLAAVIFAVLFLTSTRLAPFVIGDATFLIMAILLGRPGLDGKEFMHISAALTMGSAFFALSMAILGRIFNGRQRE